MDTKTNSRNIIINYGLILGAASVITSVTLYTLNKHLEESWTIFMISMFTMILIIVFAIKKFKLINNGFLTFGEAIKIGVGVAVIGAIIGIIYQQIFQNFIEPDFLNQKLEIARDKMLDSGLDDDVVDNQLEMAKKFQTPLITSAIGIAISAFLGFVFSAVSGAIMQKKEDN